MHRAPLGFVLVLFGLVAQDAWGHKPVVIDGGPTGPASAYVIDDVTVSQVGYHTVTPDAPQLWFTFEAEAGQQLYFELGVPKIDRLEGLRPAMVLLGPGLPAVTLPFAVPEGLGGIVFNTAGEETEVFDEEFTGTTSWKWPAVTPTAQQSGKYYAVAWLPDADTGKLWMAVGTAESFGLGDILSLPTTLFQVRAFHEIGPFGGLLFWAMLAFLLVLVFLIRLLF
ncbi:MAG: hypothetical protein IT368_00755 [Candidatus Hydrogenedentes bacterium]|nr:hypothetical protein [Candidatus Hydrogenedentota bacterium]